MNKTTKTTFIAVANQKGGVGKTTSAVNIAVGMARLGKKVLCIDFDPQCHLGKYIGHSHDDLPTITDFVYAKATFEEPPCTENVIRKSKHGIDYIPSSLRLSKVERILPQAFCCEQVLRDILATLIPEGYDYVFIDCNPSMGLLMTNALAAADYVLIPVQTEEFAIDGLEDMLQLVQMIKRNINPRLDILGLLPTLMTHTKDTRDVLELLHREFPSLTLSSGIGRYADGPRSTKNKRPVVDTKCKLADQYMAATRELLTRLEG